MIYYIRIKKLNGRRDFVELAEKLYDRGYDDRVEYHAGKEIAYGMGLEGIDPHLKFNNEEDALAIDEPRGWTDRGVGPWVEALSEVYRDGALMKEITFDEVRANARR